MCEQVCRPSGESIYLQRPNFIKRDPKTKNDEGRSFIDTAGQQRLAGICANRLVVEVWRKQRIEPPKLVDNKSACTVGRFRELDKFSASLKRISLLPIGKLSNIR